MSVAPMSTRSAQGFAAFALASALVLGGLTACGDDSAAPDDCEGTCDTPPAPTCDGTALVTFSADGICIGDDCRYEAERTECAFGCSVSGAAAACAAEGEGSGDGSGDGEGSGA